MLCGAGSCGSGFHVNVLIGIVVVIIIIIIKYSIPSIIYVRWRVVGIMMD
jgi:hypothetical protein